MAHMEYKAESQAGRSVLPNTYLSLYWETGNAIFFSRAQELKSSQLKPASPAATSRFPAGQARIEVRRSNDKMQNDALAKRSWESKASEDRRFVVPLRYQTLLSPAPPTNLLPIADACACASGGWRKRCFNLRAAKTLLFGRRDAAEGGKNKSPLAPLDPPLDFYLFLHLI